MYVSRLLLGLSHRYCAGVMKSQDTLIGHTEIKQCHDYSFTLSQNTLIEHTELYTWSNALCNTVITVVFIWVVLIDYRLLIVLKHLPLFY